MEYFQIEKTGDMPKLDGKLKLSKGYTFSHRLKITVYNDRIVESILMKKIKNSFKKIFALLDSAESDDDAANELEIRVETLRNILMHEYYPYLNKKKVKSFIIKLSEIENRVNYTKKSKSR